jgi:hypothetical protein
LKSLKVNTDLRKQSTNLSYLANKLDFKGPFMMEIIPLSLSLPNYGIGPKVLAILGFGLGIGPKPK